MPIPKDELIEACSTMEELDQLYKRFSWFKELTVEWVSSNRRFGTMVTTYNLKAERINCSCDGGSKFIFILFSSTGFIYTCGMCKRTHGHVPESLLNIVGTRRCTLQEAHEIIKRTGQRKPIGLPEIKDTKSHIRKLL